MLRRGERKKPWFWQEIMQFHPFFGSPPSFHVEKVKPREGFLKLYVCSSSSLCCTYVTGTVTPQY